MSGQEHGKRTTDARYQGCWTTYLGAMQGVLKAAGIGDYDLPTLAGMTGLGFHLIVEKGCCPSSVTVYDWLHEHLAAFDRVGVLSEMHLAMPGEHTYEAACRRAVQRLKEALDRGMGAVVWGIDSAEFGVVYGYDDGDGVFLADGVGKWWSPAGSTPILYENLGRTCDVPILHCQIPVERVSFDPAKTYRDSLVYYVGQMEKEFHDSPAYRSGFRAYDNWHNALVSGAFNPFGLRYLTAVYVEAKQLVAAYARFLAESWQGPSGLPGIAAKFDEIAKVYAAMMPALEQDFSEGGGFLGRPVAAEQAAGLAKLVKEAKLLDQEAVALVKALPAEAK